MTPIFHRSQIASLLGLPAPEEGTASVLAWDCAALLEAWLTEIRRLPFELLVTPTRSRGRTLRNLSVNVFHPFELLPDACQTGVFDWDPDRDSEQEAPLDDAGRIAGYARTRLDGWVAFLVEHGDRLDPERVVDSPRGALSLEALLAAQRWHAAFHYRQLIDVLEEHGAAATPFPLARLHGLDLPTELY